jgi:AcrR family transcriptional regulator
LFLLFDIIDKNGQILLAASKLFANEGYKVVTIKKIAEEAEGPNK